MQRALASGAEKAVEQNVDFGGTLHFHSPGKLASVCGAQHNLVVVFDATVDFKVTFCGDERTGIALSRWDSFCTVPRGKPAL